MRALGSPRHAHPGIEFLPTFRIGVANPKRFLGFGLKAIDVAARLTAEQPNSQETELSRF
jgi:hypothetical protein